MINWTLKKILGSQNQRLIKKLWPRVDEINALEEQMQTWSDNTLREKAAEWKKELSAIEDDDELEARMDELLPEAFALVKNVSRRLCGQTFDVCDQPVKWDMVHFDVQLIGGMVLHRGTIAEMATGEGKTLVATMPVFLNALSGRGAHVVTVNDYLARRDSEWMGKIYTFLGLSVGCIQNEQPPTVRRQMYRCDITYGTASEFGFDYLRDNGLATTPESQVQRGYNYAIVDEVDSVLIDEARTPLIISGPVSVDTHQYEQFRPLVDQLVKKQTQAINRLVTEAKEKLKKAEEDKNEELRWEAGRQLFKVRLGAPRNKQLLRLMENAEYRKLVDKVELSYYQDQQKTELFNLKEELFFTVDEKSRDADLSEQGREFLNPDDPEAFTLPDLATGLAEIDADESLGDEQKLKKKQELQEAVDRQSQRMHNITQLLKAYCLYEKDVHYVVEDNKVMIVDENTGRKMPGRRWSDGLHQAVEAKEGVKIDKESQTFATITIQNFFRQYRKLAGMTGTAETEANEFKDIYDLPVAVIPTNKPNQRADLNDLIFKTRREKYNRAIKEIREAHAKGQPVLVGTASVEASELVSRMLKREKIPHNVLNAKYHRQEAEIVQRAGQKGMVTISTNMAGRGTDIKLGEGVIDLGGLYVIGTERHESRRIDRQLRGRCARQGDPGQSRFFVSFEDDLMRNFGQSDKMIKIMERFGMGEDEEIEHPWLNKSVEQAQKRVEQRNYMIRKHTLDYDDVMNQQREVIYDFRNEVLHAENTRELIYEILEKQLPEKVREFLDVPPDEDPNYAGLAQWVSTTFPVGLTEKSAAFETREIHENAEYLMGLIKDAYEKKVGLADEEAVRTLEKYILLQSIDRLWQEHLYAMDSLRDGISNWTVAQKDPLVEYKKEAFAMFEDLMEYIEMEVLNNLFRGMKNLQAFERFLQQRAQQQQSGEQDENAQGGAQARKQPRPRSRALAGGAAAATRGPSEAKNPVEEIDLGLSGKPAGAAAVKKVGRNDPCPCGSGKKYKQCCGRRA